MPCSNCGNKLTETREKCPSCGQQITKDTKAEQEAALIRKKNLKFLTILHILTLLLFTYGMYQFALLRFSTDGWLRVHPGILLATLLSTIFLLIITLFVSMKNKKVLSWILLFIFYTITYIIMRF